MDFNAPDHIYPCIPGVFSLREKFDAQEKARAAAVAANIPEAEIPAVDPPVRLHLRGVTKVEIDKSNIEAAVARADLGPDKLAEFSAKQRIDLLRSHFVKAENLTVGGQPVESFDDFYRLAPPEMILWVENAVFSTEILTASERKNS